MCGLAEKRIKMHLPTLEPLPVHCDDCPCLFRSIFGNSHSVFISERSFGIFYIYVYFRLCVAFESTNRCTPDVFRTETKESIYQNSRRKLVVERLQIADSKHLQLENCKNKINAKERPEKYANAMENEQTGE